MLIHFQKHQFPTMNSLKQTSTPNIQGGFKRSIYHLSFVKQISIPQDSHKLTATTIVVEALFPVVLQASWLARRVCSTQASRVPSKLVGPSGECRNGGWSASF